MFMVGFLSNSSGCGEVKDSSHPKFHKVSCQK